MRLTHPGSTCTPASGHPGTTCLPEQKRSRTPHFRPARPLRKHQDPGGRMRLPGSGVRGRQESEASFRVWSWRATSAIEPESEG